MKVKSRTAVCVLLSLLSLIVLMFCSMALLGGEFFSYVGRSIHYIYTFLAVRPFDYKTGIVLGVSAVVLALFVYWLYVILKSEVLHLYEVIAPFTSILLPFLILAAVRANTLGIWNSADKVLVIIVLVALAIYIISSILGLIFTVVSSSKKLKEEKFANVEIVEEDTESTVDEQPKVIEKIVYVKGEEEKEPESSTSNVEPEPVVSTTKKVVRKPFAEKMANASSEIKDNYNTLKNELLSYGVKSRISHGSDTFRLRKQEYAKITLVGKNLKLYLSTKPEKYEGTTMPVRDEGSKKCFASTPTMIKVKSTLSIKRAKMMIADLMSERGLTQGPVENVDYAKQLKSKKARTAKK